MINSLGRVWLALAVGVKRWRYLWLVWDMINASFISIYEVGLIFLASPKGHQIYTLTSFKRNLIYTHQKQKYIPCFIYIYIYVHIYLYMYIYIYISLSLSLTLSWFAN